MPFQIYLVVENMVLKKKIQPKNLQTAHVLLHYPLRFASPSCWLKSRVLY